jgi:hypothetical protein
MATYSTRTAIEQCHELKISLLKKGGAIIQGALRIGELRFEAKGDHAALVVRFVCDCRNPADRFLELQHIMPDGTPAEPYRLALVPLPRHLGGQWWTALCPVRAMHSRSVFCPPGGTFASSAAHQVLVPSDRLASDDRPLHRLALARQRLERAAAVKPPARGSRGCSASTIARLRAAVSEAEQVVWAQALAKIQARENKPGTRDLIEPAAESKTPSRPIGGDGV